jgi:hypothetical protein
MRAYEDTPEAEIMKDELGLFRWAQAEGYDLGVIYQEVVEGSIAVLTELIEELKTKGDRAVVVPSEEHFGTSEVLRTYVREYLVRGAEAEVFEVSDE